MTNTAEKREIATIKDQAVTPMQMLQIAVQQGQGLEQIRELMQLEREWKADKAREAFYAALADFKQAPLHITKDKENKQYGSRYTSIGNLVNTANEAMAPFGLNARWAIDQSNGISVTCILSHTLGHSEQVTMSGPPDASGSKNPLQQIKSTVTYLKISTFEAVTGIVSTEGNLDDDGNGSGDTITAEQAAVLETLVKDVGANRAAFLKMCKVASFEELPADKLQGAMERLEAKRKGPK